MKRVGHATLKRTGKRNVKFEVEFKGDAERKRWLDITKDDDTVPVMVMFTGRSDD